MAQIVLARGGVPVIRSHDLNNDVAGWTTGEGWVFDRVHPLGLHPSTRMGKGELCGRYQMFRVGPVSAMQQQAGTECLVVWSIVGSGPVGPSDTANVGNHRG